MSTIVNNTARSPLLVAQAVCRAPVLVNDFGQDELHEVASILVQAGQRNALETLVQTDGVSASAKGIIARVLNEHKMRNH